MTFIDLWAQAIATFEGYYTPGSRPARNNNPGDLKYARQPGATGQDALGFAIFPDASTGFQALDSQLNAYVSEFPGYSLYQIMEHYLGQNITAAGGEVTSQGDSSSYGNYVASAIGVDPSTTLSALAAGATVSSAAPADPAEPLDDSGDGVPNTNGMIILLLGGAFFLWLFGRLLGGWDG